MNNSGSTPVLTTQGTPFNPAGKPMLRGVKSLVQRHIAWCRSFPAAAGLFWASYLLVLISGTRALRPEKLHHTDFNAFFHAAEHLVQGEDFYQDCTPTHRRYVYYPFFAIFIASMVPLGLRAGFVAWWVFNALLAGFSVYFMRRILESLKVSEKILNLATWLPLLACSGYFRITLNQGNVNFVILAAVLGALHLYLQGHCFRGGMLLGMAAVAKVTPGLFFIYLLVKREWRGACGFLAGAALASQGLGMVVFGWEKSLEIHWAQTKRFAGAADADIWWWGPFPSDAFNQSLAAAVHRFASPVEAGYAGNPRGHRRVNLFVWPPERIQTVIRALSLIVLFLMVASILWPRGGATPGVLLLEFAIVALSLLVLSTVTWKQHMVVMLLPYAAAIGLVAKLGRDSPRGRFLLSGLALSLVLAFATRRALLEWAGGLATTLEAYSAHLFSMLALWTVLVALRFSWPGEDLANLTTLDSNNNI